MTVLIWLFTTIHVVVALILVVIVLMQKSSDQGVGAAFGGGVTENVFGAGTTTALVRMTVWCAGIMLATTLILAVLHSHRGSAHRESLMQRATQSAPLAPNAPASQPPSMPNVPNITPSSSTGTMTPSAPANAEAPTTPAPAPATPAPAASPTKP